MTRIPKYRAYSHEFAAIVKVEYITWRVVEALQEDGFVSITGPDGFNAYYPFTDKSLVLMQWTGLVDCVGQDIYEGDRVERVSGQAITPQFQGLPVSIWTVEWDNDLAGWLPFVAMGKSDDYFHAHQWRVVGNLYERTSPDPPPAPRARSRRPPRQS